MGKWPIFLIFSFFIISCSTFNKSKSSKTLLWGDWYGGPGTKYSVTGNNKQWIQDLPAGNALFVHEQDGIFINHSANTKSFYELKGNKIYYDIDKSDKKGITSSRHYQPIL